MKVSSKKFDRVIGLVLAIVMVFSLVPAAALSVFAAEADPVCDCGTDDASIHATTCAVYVAPENPVCQCAEKCTEANVWCDVCGFDYTQCGGTDTAAAYEDAVALPTTLYVGGVEVIKGSLVGSVTSGTGWHYDTATATLYLTDGADIRYSSTTEDYLDNGIYCSSGTLNIHASGNVSITGYDSGIYLPGASLNLYAAEGAVVTIRGEGSTANGIYSTINSNVVAFSGKGTVNVSSNTDSQSDGIFAGGDIKIDGITLNVQGGSNYDDIAGTNILVGKTEAAVVNCLGPTSGGMGGSLTQKIGIYNGSTVSLCEKVREGSWVMGFCASSNNTYEIEIVDSTVIMDGLTGTSSIYAFHGTTAVSGDSHVLVRKIVSTNNGAYGLTTGSEYYQFTAEQNYYHRTDSAGEFASNAEITELGISYFELYTASHHSYHSNGDGTHYYGCSAACPAAIKGEKVACGGEVTCTEKAVCETCGASYGELGGHSFGSTGACTLCGAACLHESYENGACTDCGAACTHESYENGACTACGVVCSHSFDAVGLCSECDLRKIWLNKSSWETATIYCPDTSLEISMTKDSETGLWYGYVPKTLDGFIFRRLFTNTYNGNQFCYQTAPLSLPENANCYRMWTESSTDKDETFTYYTYSGNWYFHPCTEHNWESGKCSLCGFTCSHTGGTATCAEQAKCEVCGSWYGEKLPHNFYDYTGKCLNCGEFLAVLLETRGTHPTYYTHDQIESGKTFLFGTSLKLFADIHLKEGACLELGSGQYTLDLNGFVLYSNSNHAVYVSEDLTVMDSSSAGNGQIQSNNLETGSLTGYPTAALYGKTDRFHITVIGDVVLSGLVTFLSANNAGSGVFDLTQWNNAVDSSVHVIHATSDIYSSVLLPVGYGLTYDGMLVWPTYSVRASATLLVAKCNSHSGGTATCIAPAKCAICGESYGVPEWDYHTFNAATGKCDICDADAAAAKVTTSGGATTYYETLPAAVTAAQSRKNSTVTLLKDIDLGGEDLEITSGTFTIDLNDCTCTNFDYWGVDIEGATVTITDSGPNQEGAIIGKYYGVTVWSSGTLNLTGGTITALVGIKTYIVGTVNISGGTVIGTSAFEAAVYIEGSKSVCNITGGSISGAGYDLYRNNSSATVTLALENGKTVGATFPGGLTVYNATLNKILGSGLRYWGVVDGKDTMLTVETSATEITDSGDITVRAICDHTGSAHTTATDRGDGTHSYTCTVCNNTATEAHTMDPTTGKCVCGLEMAVAKVTSNGTDTYYETLTDALTNAQSGDTVALCADVAIGTTVHYIPTGVTFDGGAYTLSGSMSFYHLYNRGTITGGTFNLSVCNLEGGVITGGNFSRVTNEIASITGGSFELIVSNDRYGNISGSIQFRELYYRSGTIDLSQAVLTGTEKLTLEEGYELTATGIKLDTDHFALARNGNIVSTLTANGNIVVHESHNYSAVYDDTHHWKACACGKIIEQAEHTISYTRDSVTHTASCSGCDYTKTEAHAIVSTTGKCACGIDMAVATVTVGDNVTYYETLPKAIEAASAGTEDAPATVTVLKDIDVTETIEVKSGVFTLNLGGKTLRDHEDKGLLYGLFSVPYDSTAHMTIADTEGGKLLADWGVIEVAGGTVTITGGEFSYAGATFLGASVSADGGTVNISGGTIEAIHVSVDAAVNIRGGTIGAIYVSEDAAVNISGGIIRNLHVDSQNSEVNLSGGEFETIRCDENTARELLADGYSYWTQDGTIMLNPAEDTDINFVTVKATCYHPAEKLSYETVDGTTHTWSCSGCNNTGTEAHSTTNQGDKAATCTSLAYCTVCRAEYGQLLLHSFDTASGECTVCHEPIVIDATGMTPEELHEAVTERLAAGLTDITVIMISEPEVEMFTAIRRAIVDTEGVADGSIHLTLKGVTVIPRHQRYSYDPMFTPSVVFGQLYGDPGEKVTQLKSVDLPDVVRIGWSAFSGCENLESVTAPKLQIVEEGAFDGTGLTSIYLPEATFVGQYAFENCPNLTTAKLPKATTIENGVFAIREGSTAIGTALTRLELTSPEEIELSEELLGYNVNFSEGVDLVLHPNKQDQVSGTTWNGHTFKSITYICADGTTNHDLTYTDNDNGTHTCACRNCIYVPIASEPHDHRDGKCVCGRKATPVVTAPTGLTAVYNDTLAAVTLPEGFTWQDGETTSVGNAGSNTFKVTFTPADTVNYEIVKDIEVTIAVAKADPVVTEPGTVSGLVYNGGAQALITGGNTTGGTMMYSVYKGTVGPMTLVSVSYSEDIPTATDAGTYTVFYKVAGGSNYNDVEPRSMVVTIDPAPVTITGKDKTVTYNGQQIDLRDLFTIDENAGEADYTIIDLTGYGTFADAPYLYQVTKAGTFTVRLTTAANGNYAAGEATAILTVNKAAGFGTVTIEGWTYGETANRPAIGGNGDVRLLYTGENYSSAEAPTDAGTYTVTATFAATDLYEAATATAEFTISKKSVKVTADAQNKTYGDADPELTYTAVGLIGEDQLTGELARAEGENVGTYAIAQGTLTADSN